MVRSVISRGALVLDQNLKPVHIIHVGQDVSPGLVPPLRTARLLLPAAARLLHRLLHLRAAAAAGSEEGGAHAHRPQGSDHRAGSAGLLRPLQLHPPVQVGPSPSPRCTERFTWSSVLTLAPVPAGSPETEPVLL